MFVLGIDPGLRVTGYGLIRMTNKNLSLIEAGIIKTNDKQTIGQRLKRIYDDLDGIFKQHKIDVVVLEKLFAHAKHPMTASILGHVRGVAVLVTVKRKSILFEYLPTRVKKSIVGNGHASKEQVQQMVFKHLGIKSAPLEYDATDALALAMTYCFSNK
ncbi:MAG: crossover junction endodeoxyribonuclease RuvC [Candidatus Gygaella obscura]|nr:crossover junction endodeoxyribonuclease RuvC [Candidatus Gygaella obscura]